jgi:hypothetical protein
MPMMGGRTSAPCGAAAGCVPAVVRSPVACVASTRAIRTLPASSVVVTMLATLMAAA